MNKIEKIKKAIEDAENGISKLPFEILDLPSFNSHKIKHLLNNLGSFSEKYLECGIHKAGGFCCAMFGNEMIGVGIDNWSEFEQDGLSKKLAYEHCVKYLDEYKVAIRDTNCFNIKEVKAMDQGSLPFDGFDFYTYDAAHDFESQYKGIVNFLPFMAKEFILCVDDTDWEAPRIATLKAIEDLKLKILFKQHLSRNIPSDGEGWWNGFTVHLLSK